MKSWVTQLLSRLPSWIDVLEKWRSTGARVIVWGLRHFSCNMPDVGLSASIPYGFPRTTRGHSRHLWVVATTASLFPPTPTHYFKKLWRVAPFPRFRSYSWSSLLAFWCWWSSLWHQSSFGVSKHHSLDANHRLRSNCSFSGLMRPRYLRGTFAQATATASVHWMDSDV